MNSTIANVILARIEAANLPWLDKTAGLTRAISFTKGSNKGSTLPISCTVNDPLACDDSTIAELVPDENYNSILYFEGDAFPSRVKDKIPGIAFSSKLRIVVWLNCSRLGGECGCGDLAAQNLISALETRRGYATGPLLDVKHTIVGGGPARGRDIFSRYTLNEARSQYLHFPFDFFALDIETTFRVQPGCEDQLDPDNVNCWTGPTNIRRRYAKDFTCPELQDPVTGLTAEQLGAGCLDCSGSGVCPTECEVLGAITDPFTAAPCVEDEIAIAMGGSFIARPAYTADLIVEQLGNAGGTKVDDVRDLLCVPCPLTISVNGDELATVSDPCSTPSVNYEAVDSDGNAISTSIVGGKIVANDLPCAGACPYDGIIQINGVQVGTFGPFDPCVDNTLTININ